jgi:hypothetical protein
MLTKSAEYEEISEYTLASLLNRLTNTLKIKARNTGWPYSAYNVLSVTSDETGYMYVDYPQAQSQDIEDLEFGSDGVPPNPVLRPFLSEAELIIDDVMRGQLAEDLMLSLDVL